MDIPPVKPPGGTPPTSGAEAAGSSDLPFATGQRLFARVVQVSGGADAVLELAGLFVKTTTPVPVAAGQVLHVAVRGVAPAIDLELLEAPLQFSPRAYALASVLTARQQAGETPRLTASHATALLGLLAGPDSRGTPPAADSPRAHAASALAPVPLAADAADLAQRLRALVHATATPLESKLAQLLASNRPPPNVVQQAGALADDGRVLLAAAASETAESPVLERARAALAGDVLLRQLDLALHDVRDGDIRLDLPVAADGSTTDLRLRVRDDAARDRGEPPGDGRAVDVMLELSELGRVRASLHWSPGRVAARFAVEGPPAEAALREGLTYLVQRLTAAGFGAVSADVRVDPLAVHALDDEGGPPLPGGSILRTRA